MTQPQKGKPIEQKPSLFNSKFVLAGLSVVAVFTLAALNRLVGGDEGYYLYAAKLVSQGQVLYKDFFYTQMPLLPYVFGAWMKIFGTSWLSARLLCALLGIGTGVLLAFSVPHKDRPLALLLYAFCAACFGEFSQGKTYALTSLLLVGALMLISGKRMLGAGILLGLAVLTRLMMLVTVPIFVVYLLRTGGGGRSRLPAYWLVR